MAGDKSIVAGMAGRYASALFELAVESKSVDKISKELGSVSDMMSESADLQRLVRSPIFSASDQLTALNSVLSKAKISGLTANFIGILAKNRRLYALSDMIKAFNELVADHKGELSAEVTSAVKLTAAQIKSLQTSLKSVVGKDVSVNTEVDESILGGLIVKVGSRMIDTSLRTKLNNLRLAMKEVG